MQSVFGMFDKSGTNNTGDGDIRKFKRMIKSYSKESLKSIFSNSLRHGYWDRRLGKMPPRWNNMANSEKNKYARLVYIAAGRIEPIELVGMILVPIITSAIITIVLLS